MKNVEKAATKGKASKVKTGDKPAKINKIKYHGVGRRKTAVARVFISRGNGIFNVNGIPHGTYFNTEIDIKNVEKPVNTASLSGMLDIRVNVYGSGKTAQSDAVKLGVARSLVEFNAELRSILRQEGLLTVDSRNKERKKYGQKAARRKFQFVKR
jgi:small subunit ribosomal protein S9